MDDHTGMDFEISIEAQLHAQRIAFGALVAIIDDGEPNSLSATLSSLLVSLSDSVEMPDISAALREISATISDN